MKATIGNMHKKLVDNLLIKWGNSVGKLQNPFK